MPKAKSQKAPSIEWEPLNDQILVRRVKAEEKTDGGLAIPDAYSERPLEAEVLRVGQAVKYVFMGDRVLFSKFSGTEVKLFGEALLMLREQECLARHR